MLTNITLENFKAFQKLDNLKVKPITILCGTNSCGKSSILQSILLLKQTLESKNPNQNLLLNGRFVKLGYFEDIIYQKNKANEVKISLSLNNMTDKALGFSYYTDPNYQSSAYHDPYRFFYDTEVSLLLKTENNLTVIQEISLKVWIDDKHGTYELMQIILSKQEGKTYIVKWTNIEIENKRQGETELQIDFSNFFQINLNFEGLNFKQKTQKIENFKNLSQFFSLFEDCLKDIYAKYTYLGPLRGEPEREYIYRDEVVEIGNKGENAAFLYLAQQNELVNSHFFYNKINDNFEKISQLSLKDALNKWFDLMKIDNFDGEIINKIIYLSLNASKYDQTKVGIADVGFGVSQIFPIVLEGLRMEKGSTLLLEQPEIHLHPNLQMQMADYFISLALSGKRVMAETHSDHIINRLVRRIVEDDTQNLKDLIGIYFIKPSENGSVYEQIHIDDTKGITNWPVDFFDQTANEQLRIMQAGLKKRKNLRNPIPNSL